MKLNKILLLVLLILPIVLAEPQFYFKRLQPSNITFQCTIEGSGSRCNSDFECNLTVQDPDSKIIIDDDAFTNNRSYFNYSIPSNLNDVVGDYNARVFCSNVSHGVGKSFIYRVNNSGKPDSDMSLIGIFIILGIMIIGYLYASFQVDESHYPVKALLFFIAFINMAGGLFTALLTQTNWFNMFLIIETLGILNGFVILILAYYYILYIPRRKLDQMYEK